VGNNVTSISRTSNISRTSKIWRFGILVFAAGLLAACSSLSMIGLGDDEEEENVQLCPAASILGNAERVAQFKQGAGRDLIDVMFQAEIGKLNMTCRYLKGRVVTDISFELIAERGPAARNRTGEFDYFVAISDPKGRVLAKENFHSKIAFAENRRRAGILEEIEQSIPLRKDEDGGAYEILVGFQLTEDQMKFNRRK
jgi:hypothetical protein